MMNYALRRLVSLMKNKCRNHHGKYWFWRNSRRMTAITYASPKAVVLALLVLLVGG